MSEELAFYVCSDCDRGHPDPCRIVHTVECKTISEPEPFIPAAEAQTGIVFTNEEIRALLRSCWLLPETGRSGPYPPPIEIQRSCHDKLRAALAQDSAARNE